MMGSGSIRLHVYVCGVMREDTYEDFDSEAMTQIVADFPYPDRDNPHVSRMFHRCNFPQKPDVEGGFMEEKMTLHLTQPSRSVAIYASCGPGR